MDCGFWHFGKKSAIESLLIVENSKAMYLKVFQNFFNLLIRGLIEGLKTD